ncbi:MAG: 4-(cytidine 5'-diphospho)-2-C-methyl-D-erythritol kinase [Deltaproteobacteria bacterium]
MRAVISEFAPAKVNLALHVTGKRADGYHFLDSLVVFAGVGDVVEVGVADVLSLTIDGPFGGALTGDNLVLRAAHAFGAGRGAAIHLTKNLPLASGVGGGSADAAATLRALSRLWDMAVPDALALGADVPVCLAARAARMSGVGEVLAALPALPALGIVLANPGLAVSTASVFRNLSGFGSALPALRAWTDAADFAGWLGDCRNDLQAPAEALCPAIMPLLAETSALTGCLLARMSGSGATCFGLFADLALAEAAARDLQLERPSEWVRAAAILP